MAMRRRTGFPQPQPHPHSLVGAAIGVNPDGTYTIRDQGTFIRISATGDLLEASSLGYAFPLVPRPDHGRGSDAWQEQQEIGRHWLEYVHQAIEELGLPASPADPDWAVTDLAAVGE